MSTLGSKSEKFASIFQRLNGLIEKGALPMDQRPLWYDVYKAFPPKIEPIFNRPAPSSPVREILYSEDIKRAIVAKCDEIEHKHPELQNEDEFFEKVEAELQKDSIFLKKRI